MPKHTVLGVAQQVSEALIDKINAGDESDINSPTRPPRKRKNEALYEKLLPGKLDHLTSEDRRHIEPIMIKYAHVFHDENENDLNALMWWNTKYRWATQNPLGSRHIELPTH